MKFRRIYSAPGDTYAGVNFEPRTSRIANPDGRVVFEAKDAMVPTGWTQVAVDVLAQKYFRKAGVPTELKRIPAGAFEAVDESSLMIDPNSTRVPAAAAGQSLASGWHSTWQGQSP